MKQVHASYSFVTSTKTITLTGLNIDQDQLLLIVNATRGVQYFNFADSSLRGVVTSGANTTVVLTDASTAGHSNSDALVIYYDDQVASQAVTGTVTANPGTGAFTVTGTVGLDPASLSALENVTVTIGSSVTVSGTVTAANIPTKLFDDAFEGGEVVVAQLINADGQVSIANPLGISGTVTANVFGYDQPNDSFAQIRVQEAGELISQITPVLAVGIANQNGGINESNPLPISGTVTANVYGIDQSNFSQAMDFYATNWNEPLPINLTQTSVTLPISGTVTANGGDFAKTPAADTLPPAKSIRIGFGDDENWYGVGLAAGGSPLPVILYSNQQEAFGGSTNGMVPFQVFGTVTVGNSVTIGSCVTHGVTIANSSVTVNGTFWQATQPVSLASVPTHGVTLASTTVTVSSLPNVTIGNSSITVNGNFYQATQPVSLASVPTHGVTLASTTVTVSSLPSISGTVTANLSRPTWADYSGTITTAGTAVTAISNTSRSYLLAQVTTGQLFLNIGATATTLNSVYFSAGQGFAWETSVPQGIVSIISTVTGTNYVLKEG